MHCRGAIFKLNVYFAVKEVAATISEAIHRDFAGIAERLHRDCTFRGCFGQVLFPPVFDYGFQSGAKEYIV